MTLNFSIATARTDITPDEPLPLAGYLARKGVSDRATPDTLQAAITGLRIDEDDAIWLISIDTLFVDDAFVNQLAIDVTAMGLTVSPQNLIIIASHTHGAPNALATPIAGCLPAQTYRKWILAQLAAAICAAAKHWSAVTKITQGYANGPKIVNRRRIGLYFDRTARRLRWGVHYGHNHNGIRSCNLYALRFWTSDGLAAIWWSLAAHPAFYPDMRAVTADFPGTLRTHVLNATPKVAVSFFPGLSGSTIPAVDRHPYRPKGLKQWIMRLPLIPGLGGFTPQSYARWCGTLRDAWGHLKPQALNMLQGKLQLSSTRITSVFRSDDPALAVNVKRLDLPGGVTHVFLSGEPLAEWAPVLASGLPEGAMVTGYVAGPPAYVAPAACLKDGGYEVNGFQEAFGLTGQVSPDVDQKLRAALETLCATDNFKLK